MNRYKGLFSLILVTALLWNIFHVAITYGYYYVDQSGFIAQFCVNIEKPELECNGKCHLKNVAEKDSTNDKAPLKMITSKDVPFFIQEKEKLEFGYITYNKKPIKKYRNLYSFLSEYSLYQPPQV
ncbi:MAG: hypothetical protein IMY67_10765 [Bacteroidetes bacterium]|nr:hypothetical protein [Bacteroidota bacterium]